MIGTPPNRNEQLEKQLEYMYSTIDDIKDRYFARGLFAGFFLGVLAVSIIVKVYS